MEPPITTATDWRNRAVALGLVVLVTGSMFASAAAAVPAMGFRGADVSETEVVVGEPVVVNASVINVGSSGGGYTFEFERNGSKFAEQRVQVPVNEVREVNRTISFDSPGTYRLTVSGNLAGVVTVRPALARVVAENDSQRRISVRASGVPTAPATTFDIPSTNRSFAVQQWSPATEQSTYQQTLTEYTDATASPDPSPPGEQSTIVGLVEADTNESFGTATMRLAVNESAFSNTTLSADQATVYQRNGSTWDRLPTTLVADESGSVVYEATATQPSVYAVGRIDPQISITSTSLRSAATENGQRLTLDGRLNNTAPVSGEYVGALTVNGEEVNRSEVTVPATGNTGISLSYEVSDPGTYTMALNGTTAGQVIISESQLQDEPTTAETEASQESDSGGGSALPASVFGVDTAYLLGGLAIALGAFVAILAMLRRGGGGSNSFDDF